MMKEVVIPAVIGIFILICSITALSFIFPSSFQGDHCSVCEWNWAYSELRDYDDIGYGHRGALGEIWTEVNYGRYKADLVWLENYRLKYGIDDVPSFEFINYSNPKPNAPGLKYLGTGYIVNYLPWEKAGAYSKTVVNINGTNMTYNNCAWNPYPYNISNLTHVFKKPGGAWFNNFKEASLFDASIYVDKPERVNESWNIYYGKLDLYYLNGGYKKP